MMSANQKTLLAIAAFVALCVGSFIWFIATWDATREEPVSHAAPTATPAILGAPA